MTQTIYTFDSGGNGSLPDGGNPDYSSISTFEAATDNDLSGVGEIILDIYDSQEHVESGYDISFQGSTNVSREDFRHIRSSPNCVIPFAGHKDSGAKFLFNNTISAAGYSFSEPFFICEDLSFRSISNTQTVSHVIKAGDIAVSYAKGSDQLIKNCIIYDSYNTDGVSGNFYAFTTSTGCTVTFYNCLVYNFNNQDEASDALTSYGFYSVSQGGQMSFVINCAAIGISKSGATGYGIYIHSYFNVIFNCYAANCQTACYFGSNSNSRDGFCIADDETADQVDSTNYKNSVSLSTLDLDENYLSKVTSVLSWDGGSADNAGINPFDSLNYPCSYFLGMRSNLPIYPADDPLDTDLTVNNNRNYRIFWAYSLDNKNIYRYGSQIRLKLEAHSTQDTVIDGCSIGFRSGNTSYYDFIETPTRITFNGGNNGVTIPAGTSIYSDWIDFELNIGSYLMIHLYFANNPHYVRMSPENIYAATSSYVDGAGADHTLVADVSGYSYDVVYPCLLEVDVRDEQGKLGWNEDIRGQLRNIDTDAQWPVGPSGGSVYNVSTYDSGGNGSLPDGGNPDYSSLITWESDTDNDLSGVGIVCLDCYKSQLHVITSRLHISGATNIDFYNRRMIRSADATNFKGYENTGANFKWTSVGFYIAAIDLGEAFVELNSFCISVQVDSVSTCGAIRVGSVSNTYDCRLLNLVIHDCYNESTGIYGMFNTPNGGVLVYNCIIKNIGTDALHASGYVGRGVLFQYSYFCTVFVNNTIINCKNTGFHSAAGSTQSFVVYNNLIQECPDGCFVNTPTSISVRSGWNCVDDDTADIYNATYYKNNADVMDQLDEYYHAKKGAVLSWDNGSGDSAGRNPFDGFEPYYDCDFFPSTQLSYMIKRRTNDRDKTLTGPCNVRAFGITPKKYISRFKIRLEAHSTQNTIITEASVGYCGMTTDDFTSTPVRVTFNNGDYGVTIPAGEMIDSDWVYLSMTANKFVKVHLYSDESTFYMRSSYDAYYYGFYDESSAQSDCFVQNISYGQSTDYHGPVVLFLYDNISDGILGWNKDIGGITERSLIADDQWNVGASQEGFPKPKGIQAFINT